MPTKIVEQFGDLESLSAIRAEWASSIALTVKNGFSCLRGDVLGVITASGLARRRSRTTAAGTGFGIGSAVGQVTDASVFAVGDVLKNLAGTTIGTVQSIDTVANPDTVTLTANAAVAVAAAADVLASDGSQVAKAISDKASDGVGDTVINVLVTGLLAESKLRGLDASAKAEIGGASVAGGIFKF